MTLEERFDAAQDEIAYLKNEINELKIELFAAQESKDLKYQVLEQVSALMLKLEG